MQLESRMAHVDRHIFQTALLQGARATQATATAARAAAAASTSTTNSLGALQVLPNLLLIGQNW